MTAAARPRLAGQFAWASGGRIAAALLQALLLVLVARAMLPADFGLLASVLGVATVIQTALDMGVSTFVTRERAANPESGAIATALRFNAITSIGMALVSGLALAALGLIDQRFLFLIPLAVWMSAERTADVRLSVAFADGHVHVNSLNLVSRRIASIVCFMGLAWSGVNPLLAYAVAQSLAALGSSVFAQFYVRRHITAASDISFRNFLRLSWPYWLNSVSTQLRNLDSAITGLVAGATQAGYFAVASRLTSPLRILPTTLSAVLLPNASRADRRGIAQLARLALIAFGISAVFFGLIAALVPWGLPALLGEDYAGAVPAVLIVVLGLPFASAVSLYSSLLQGMGKKHYVATVSTISVIVCLLGVATMGFLWGAVGASWALTLTFAAQSVAISSGFMMTHRSMKED